MLTGCNMQDGDQVDKVLWAMSRWNDRVQSRLFSGQRLAQTYRPDQITHPFPFNAFIRNITRRKSICSTIVWKSPVRWRKSAVDAGTATASAATEPDHPADLH